MSRLVLTAFLLSAAAGCSDGPPKVVALQGACEIESDCAKGFTCLKGLCLPTTCTDLLLNGNETDIDCGGDCLKCPEGSSCVAALDCSSNFCGTDAICRDCSGGDDCDGTYCSAGVCVAKIDQGAECEADEQCASGYCVDGNCCDGPCDGSCEVCTGGVCVFVGAGVDSAGDCAAGDQCGLDGTCDGQGGCRIAPEGTGCTVEACGPGGTVAASCDGQGICDSDAGCGAFGCNVDTCFLSCTGDGQCAGGHYCNASNQCLPKKTQGMTCTENNECVTGQCSDGFCCNNACPGECMSCAGADTGGENGTCAAVTAGTDPGNECPDPLTGSCASSGVCGISGCEPVAADTQCASLTCVNGIEYSVRTCDGSGTCTPATTTSCFPYVCNGNRCYNSCSSDSHCVAGRICSGTKCILDVPKDPCVTGGTSEGNYNCP